RQHDDGTDRHHEDDRRVHERALDLVPRLQVAPDVSRELGEDVVETPGELGGTDHVDVELREEALVGTERVRERLARDERVTNAVQYLAEDLVVGLLLDHIEGLDQWDARAHERRQLAREVHQEVLLDLLLRDLELEDVPLLAKLLDVKSLFDETGHRGL